MKDDVTMARMPDLEKFADEHELKIVTIADVIQYRMQNEIFVHRGATARLPTVAGGEFQVIAYTNDIDDYTHLALVKGEIRPEEEVLVRVHSECLTGDVFGSLRCDCGGQLRAAMLRIGREEKGVILYMRNHEGRGIGLLNKIKAYGLQEQGLDTVEANLAGTAGRPSRLRYRCPDAGDLGVAELRSLTITRPRSWDCKAMNHHCRTVPLEIRPMCVTLTT